MRYTVHTQRTFHHRITKYLGVLVVTALVATLGLPSVAQAQIIANNDGAGAGGIVYTDGAGFAITWTTNLDTANKVKNWIVTVTNPDDTTMVVNARSTPASTLGAVDGAGTGGAEELGMHGTKTLNYNKTDLGIWWFQVDACLDELTLPITSAGACPSGKSVAGTPVGYTHGAPAAPANLAVNAVPGGVALTWKDMASDRAIRGYQYAFEMTAADKPKWESTSGGSAVIEADPGEHTFMLRALGTSDNDTSTDPPILGVAVSKMVTVPMPTPTLPEIAMLLLAMLLLGSGAYLLRGRQSGGLSQA